MSERHQILNDQNFWARLEYAASRWLENSGDHALRRFWIDGFLPEAPKDTEFGIDVEGTAWVGEGPRQQQQFHSIASLPQKMLHRRTPCFTIERLSLNEGDPLLQIVLACTRAQAGRSSMPNLGPGTPGTDSGSTRPRS